ncbi:hypothetical protein G3R49_15385 [Shewanella sp. WXL01]|uniref:VOC family protein n=1 Tax=Shewanella maritima TaxID=2520507 RepID=A0A411PH97_9GAMM|nr:MULTISPECIES: hypothetical protein [Shewanella]NKF51947.1 hypothetical protein [Shewanella sp. WXL01]QBF82976.1 hypothetical protein EXU30_09940 [Shewanella maritima]
MNFDWHELHTNEFEENLKFYTSTFAVNVRKLRGRNGKRYALLTRVGEPMPSSGIVESDVNQGWKSFIKVINVDLAKQKAIRNGAMEVESYDIPRVGSVCELVEPSGSKVSFIQYDPR